MEKEFCTVLPDKVIEMMVMTMMMIDKMVVKMMIPMMMIAVMTMTIYERIATVYQLTHRIGRQRRKPS